MGIKTEMSLIATHIAENWTTTPIDFGWNRDFDPNSADDTAPHTAGGPWIRLSIIPVDSAREYYDGVPGSNLLRRRLLAIQVFVPKNSTDALALQYADTLGDLFWDRDLGEILDFGVPDLSVIGEDPAGGPWFQVNVTVPYEYEQARGELSILSFSEIELTQAAHGFTNLGTPVYDTGSLVFAAADRTDVAKLCQALILRITDENRITVVYPGRLVEIPGHGLGVNGAPFYLGVGELSATPPTGGSGHYEQQLGEVVDANRLRFFTYDATVA